MKKNILILPIILASYTQFAQEPVNTDTLWKFDGAVSLNLSQLSLTNWAAGGDNSISGNALFNLSAAYQAEKTSWENKLILGAGPCNGTGRGDTFFSQ